MFEHKNILVTGGAGFIGSHLCEYLLREGHRVICLDNLSTGDAKNIQHLLQHQNFRFMKLDVNEKFDLDSMHELAEFKIPFQGIQEIFHLACPTSIKNFDQYKIQTLLANSLGNYHILDLALKYRAKILLGSSSVVYGFREHHDSFVHEEDLGIVNHLSPRGCYDEGKRFSEAMFETYRQVHSLDIRIARICRTYGPRMPLFDGQLIPDFILNALDGKDLLIYGGLGFRTSFVYVSDLIDGLIRVMNAQNYSGPTNLGSDVDMRLEDVAKLVIQMTESSSSIVPSDAMTFIAELVLPRIDRAKDLGWFPLVRLEDGLRQTIEYLKANKLLLTSL